MAKSTNVELDDKSLEVLKKVDALHRNALINLGIHMIAKTNYYRGLSGDVDDVMAVVGLDDAVDSLNSDASISLQEKTTAEEPNKRSKPSIDIGFDDF